MKMHLNGRGDKERNLETINETLKRKVESLENTRRQQRITINEQHEANVALGERVNQLEEMGQRRELAINRYYKEVERLQQQVNQLIDKKEELQAEGHGWQNMAQAAENNYLNETAKVNCLKGLVTDATRRAHGLSVQIEEVRQQVSQSENPENNLQTSLEKIQQELMYYSQFHF
ncbi:unnamed protein product [Linum trigynum]|uniref:Uncharacterized protein n=1 Tax=Linum trigynum TaxID=586398 RepID=A0AAV2ER26_9ROSI